MEIFLFVGTIAAAFFAYNAGTAQGQKQALEKIARSAHGGMNPQSVFARTYGRPGFYFDDLHADLNVGPLAVTSSATLLTLLARERLGNEASQEELSSEVDKMADTYHLANGWTPEKLAAVKEISNRL